LVSKEQTNFHHSSTETNEVCNLTDARTAGQAGSGRAEKTRVFRAEKILPMTVPWDVSELSFQAGPELGRAAREFYSVKQLKTTFQAGLEPK
jgi:hypothetical protein